MDRIVSQGDQQMKQKKKNVRLIWFTTCCGISVFRISCAQFDEIAMTNTRKEAKSIRTCSACSTVALQL